ncbi:MAG: flagellar hook-associated protein FlgL [Thermodesulfobacteriota bacterium]
MRVTSFLPYNQLARGLKDQLAELTILSNQMATGKKISKTSDDVSGTVDALGYRLSLSGNEQYERNITRASTVLDFTETTLEQVASVLDSLREIVLDGSDSSLSEADRTYYAEKAALIRDHLLELGNTTFEDRYIFSGFQTDQPAYVYDAVNHRYSYQGDSGQLQLAVDRGLTQTINFAGSSADPSISTAFSYTLNTPQTVTLADGSTVTYTPLPDPGSGVTFIEVDITHPDHPGDPEYEDHFHFSNFMEMTDLLSQAWQYQDLDGTALSSSESLRRISAMAVPLEKSEDQVTLVRAELAARHLQLENQEEGLQANSETLKNALSEMEDADMAETIIALQQVAVTLEALRMSSSRILSQSLFDFLS